SQVPPQAGDQGRARRPARRRRAGLRRGAATPVKPVTCDGCGRTMTFAEGEAEAVRRPAPNANRCTRCPAFNTLMSRAEAVERFLETVPPLDRPAIGWQGLMTALGWSREDLDLVYCWIILRVKGVLVTCPGGFHRVPEGSAELKH